MITTVTTSTITSITTVTAMGFGMALGLVAVLALIAFLCARELAVVTDNRAYRLLVKSLNVGIVPLAVAFAVIVVVRIVEILA